MSINRMYIAMILYVLTKYHQHKQPTHHGAGEN